MKKVMRLVLTVVLIVSVLVGCGSKATEDVKESNGAKVKESNKSEATVESSEPTTIKVWTLNRHDADYMSGIVDQFNAAHDDIKIEYQIYTENYVQAIELSNSTGDGPDIMIYNENLYAKFIEQGFIEPLDQFLTEEYKARFGEGAFIDGLNMKDGKIYSLPAVGTTPRLIYNKDIFEKAGITKVPESLDEMVEAAKQISDKLSGEGIYGFAQNLKKPSSGLSRSIDYISMRSGGNNRGYDFKTGKYDFSVYKPIVEAYTEIFTSNAAFPGCESLDIDPLRTQFANGKIGMYISWTHSEPGVYLNQFPTDQNWDVAQLPTIDGEVKGSQDVLLAGRWFLMSSATKNKEAAWEVMKHIYSDDVLAGYHEKGLGNVMVPSVRAIAKNPSTIEERKGLAFTDKDKIWAIAPAGRTSISPMGNDMYATMVQLMYGISDDVDGTLTDLSDRYNAALDKAIKDGMVERIIIEGFNPANPGKN